MHSTADERPRILERAEKRKGERESCCSSHLAHKLGQPRGRPALLLHSSSLERLCFRGEKEAQQIGDKCFGAHVHAYIDKHPLALGVSSANTGLLFSSLSLPELFQSLSIVRTQQSHRRNPFDLLDIAANSSTFLVGAFRVRWSISFRVHDVSKDLLHAVRRIQPMLGSRNITVSIAQSRLDS